jgi:hypothetical protein
MLVEGPTTDVTERYRMVDFVAGATFEPQQFANRAAFAVQRRDGDRWRALVDCTHTPLRELAARGAQVIAESPVSLEELFVGLAREREQP